MFRLHNLPLNYKHQDCYEWPSLGRGEANYFTYLKFFFITLFTLWPITHSWTHTHLLIVYLWLEGEISVCKSFYFIHCCIHHPEQSLTLGDGRIIRWIPWMNEIRETEAPRLAQSPSGVSSKARCHGLCYWPCLRHPPVTGPSAKWVCSSHMVFWLVRLMGCGWNRKGPLLTLELERSICFHSPLLPFCHHWRKAHRDEPTGPRMMKNTWGKPWLW